MRLLILLAFVLLSSLVFNQENYQFDEETFSAIVLLEKKVGNDFITHGTGTLFYDDTDDNNCIVVTCSHLLNEDHIYVSINTTELFQKHIQLNKFENKVICFDTTENCWNYVNGRIRKRISLKKDKSYVTHDSLDIAAFKIRFFFKSLINGDTLNIANPNRISKQSMKLRNDIVVGEEIFFLGFPFGIGSDSSLIINDTNPYENNLSNPLYRGGAIAWKSNDSKEFLLDAFSYGGNSGSPVFTKTIVKIENDLIIRDRRKLIGMVIGHLGLKYENFGLARCLWVDDIIDVIQKLNTLKSK